MIKASVVKASGYKASLRTLDPSQPELNEFLSSYNAGNFELVVSKAKALTQKYPNHPFGWHYLGITLAQSGRLADAVEPLSTCVRLDPTRPVSHNNLGNVLKEVGQLAEAEVHYQEALHLKPDYAEAHCNLGATLQELERLSEAELSYQEAIRLKPDFAEAHNNLGTMFQELGRLSEAELSYREALRLKPCFAKAHNNLAHVFQALGRLSEAVATYREALRLKPEFSEAHSNLIFSLNYIESLPPDAILTEAKSYGATVSAKAKPKFTSWLIDPNVTTLRIGFVSGDLRNHPVGYFLEGLIKHLDRRQFELYAFPTITSVDELTDRIRPYFNRWISIYGKADREAASVIHDQAIHILIDLSGHTAFNRLPVFAYKPAPIQVSWLGYCATTGLPEMDYYIGDPYASPEEEATNFTEKIWNLPETSFSFTSSGTLEQPASLPAIRNGFVTFGCFGNRSKINDEVIKVWSTIMRTCEETKLFLKSKQFGDLNAANEIRAKFASQGIAGDRVMLRGHTSRKEYLSAFNQVDMMLDTFPYTGVTVTFEALSMGVPVLTLKGDRFWARMGESIAQNAGLVNWIAKDHEDYVHKAIAFASDLYGLAKSRQDLRGRILETPLFDTRRFAKNFGVALRGMWANR